MAQKQGESSQFTGVVQDKTFAPGSKSERVSAHLVLDNGEALRLRRRGAVSYGDTELEGLLGKSITATGTVRNGVLFLEDWREN